MGKDLGSLEVGKKADVTLLDIMRPEWQPVHNPIANLVYCAHGGCADTVIVDGKALMRGGKVLTLNEHDLYEEAQDRATSLIRRTGLNRPWLDMADVLALQTTRCLDHNDPWTQLPKPHPVFGAGERMAFFIRTNRKRLPNGLMSADGTTRTSRDARVGIAMKCRADPG